MAGGQIPTVLCVPQVPLIPLTEWHASRSCVPSLLGSPRPGLRDRRAHPAVEFRSRWGQINREMLER